MPSGNQSKILIAIVALLLVAVAAQSLNMYFAQRRAERLEQKLEQALAAPRANAPGIETQVAAAEPRQPAARKFTADTAMGQATWTALVEVNRRWLAALDKARQGGAVDLDEEARLRDARVRQILAGANVPNAKYQAFVGGLPGDRVSAASKGGTTYEGVLFE